MKLGPLHGRILETLKQDETVQRKHRYTAMGIFKRLRDEEGYDFDAVRRFVRKNRIRSENYSFRWITIQVGASKPTLANAPSTFLRDARRSAC